MYIYLFIFKDTNNKKSPEALNQHHSLSGKVIFLLHEIIISYDFKIELSINEEITNYTKYVSEYIGDADNLYLK